MSGVNDDYYVHYYIQQQNASIAKEPFLSTSAPVSKQWRTDDSSLRAGLRENVSVNQLSLKWHKRKWSNLHKQTCCDFNNTEHHCMTTCNAPSLRAKSFILIYLHVLSRLRVQRKCANGTKMCTKLVLSSFCMQQFQSYEKGYHSIWLYTYYIYISGGPLSALTCCVNVRLLSAIKKISSLIYSQSWVGSWVYTTQAMMTFTLIF